NELHTPTGVLAPMPSPPEPFLFQSKSGCHYINGTQHVQHLHRDFWGRPESLRFGSDMGLVPVAQLGRPEAEFTNTHLEEPQHWRNQVDTVCQHEYPSVSVRPSAPLSSPKVKISTQSGSLHHPTLLVCSMTGFYPSEIEIMWFRNGLEETAGVVSMDLIQNRDWTFQFLMEHVSLGSPVTVHWEPQSESTGIKMLTGIGGFVLGLIFLVLVWGLPFLCKMDFFV
uniref:Ig-like domain-containing protein n=1 Tax=Sphenodon punctatus TaxID=8508 RepID=A0A8D0GV88_SPHPU